MKLKFNHILLEPAAGGTGAAGGGTPPDWRASLPEDIRGEASLATIPSVAELAKGYVHAQRLVGTDKIPAPQKTWQKAQWDEFFGKIGRPAEPGAYKFSDVKVESGVAVDQEKLTALRAKFHEIGLTNDQADQIYKYYLGSIDATAQSEKNAAQSRQQAAINTLKQEFGADFDNNVALAKAVVQQHGSPELVQFLNESGLGDHPQLVKFLYRVSKITAEDTARSGTSPTALTGAPQAKAEIDKVVNDPEFMKAMNDRTHPGHKAAVDRWMRLHSIAYPGTSA